MYIYIYTSSRYSVASWEIELDTPKLYSDFPQLSKPFGWIQSHRRSIPSHLYALYIGPMCPVSPGAPGRPFGGRGPVFFHSEKVDRFPGWIWTMAWLFRVWSMGGLKSYQFILILQMRNRQKGWSRILHVSALLSWTWLQTIESDIVNYKNDTLNILKYNWLVHFCLRPNSWAKNLGAEHPEKALEFSTLSHWLKLFILFQGLASPKAIHKAIAKRYPSYSEMLIKPSCPIRLPGDLYYAFTRRFLHVSSPIGVPGVKDAFALAWAPPLGASCGVSVLLPHQLISRWSVFFFEHPKNHPKKASPKNCQLNWFKITCLKYPSNKGN